MAARLIGFVGVDKYDIIHYLANILTTLNKKVLVVDSSEYGSIKSTIPAIFKEEQDVFSYRKFDVLLNPKGANVNFNDYDFVLIDFGFDVKNPILVNMHEVYMVTDMQMFNVNRLMELEIGLYQERFLIVRDIVKLKSIDSYIMSEFTAKSIGPHNTFALRFDETDKVRMLDCMYTDDYKFKDVTSSMQGVLYGILSPYVGEKEFTKAFKSASKGGK